MPRLGSGSPSARILVVGECWGNSEEQYNEPLAGEAGKEFSRLLHEAGIMQSECYFTNLVNTRPPNGDIASWIALKKKDITSRHKVMRDKYVLPIILEGYSRLIKEIDHVKPNIIVALGNASLWALTGAWGADKWRGSQLLARKEQADLFEGWEYKCIPTLHPRRVLAQWDVRALVLSDLKRVAKEVSTRSYSNTPKWNFLLRPSFNTVQKVLDDLLYKVGCGEVWVDLDLETRAGHIACCGLSWSKTDALCIPFMCVESREGYWSVEEEASIIHTLYLLLTDKNCLVRWQNGLYDAQYIYRHWHFIPNGKQDTMISHHTLFAGLPKRLDFQASMYCDYYVYWKDDGKTWEKDVGEDQLWSYNCVDCVRTNEVGNVELETIQRFGLAEVEAFQQKLFYPVLQAMTRGVRIDEKERSRFAFELQDEMYKREKYFLEVLGHPLNPGSPLQMKNFFYGDLAIKPVMSKAKKGIPAHVTCDDNALVTIMQREPITKPLIRAIQEYRSLGVFLRTFVLAGLDYDKRMRCSYNICGTETYRFSSSKNPFESGTNLQNIPKGNDEDGLKLPNVRKLFIPDTGYTFFDMDLDRADLQVVVWESGEEELKAALRLGVDMHLLNAYTLANRTLPDLAELVEGHPRYLEHRVPYKKERQLAKSFIHGCVTAGHEMLTPEGWVDVAEYKDGTPIMIWDNDSLKWEIPSYFHRDKAIDLITYKGEAWSQEMTFDHRVLYKVDSNGYHTKRACDVPHSARLPKGGYFWNGVSEEDSLLFARRVAAFQADGTTDISGATVFHIAKTRKRERLLKLFPNARFSTWSDGTFGCREVLGIPPEFKYAGPWILKWTSAMMDAWLDELPHWDGTFGETGRVEIMGINRQHIEWVATIAHLRGKGASVGVKRNRPDGRQDLWHVGLNNRPLARLSSMQVTRRLTEPTKVYCPKTSSGYFLFRREGKIGVTGNTNYGGGARTMAIAAGVTVHQADRFQKIYFGKYPGLKSWHERVYRQLTTKRFVQNAFGYRRYYFDRTDGLLPEALAWIPQSTVANVINRAWVNIYEQAPEIQILLQVHDSLAGQFPSNNTAACLEKLRDLSQIVIPYPDPLIIPTGVKISTKSWGACE